MHTYNFNNQEKKGVNFSVVSEEILLCGAAEYPHDLEPSAAQQIVQSLPALLRHAWFFHLVRRSLS